MTQRPLPDWAGGLIGVAAAAALTLLLREGSQAFQTAAAVFPSNITPAAWLLVSGGVALSAALRAGRVHILIVAVPTVCFLIRFGPILVGTEGVPSWYPEWLGRHALDDTPGVSFVILGLLVATTVDALVRKRPTATPAGRSNPRSLITRRTATTGARL